MNPSEPRDTQGHVSVRPLLAILFLALLPALLWAAPPAWWQARGVIKTGTDGASVQANDYAAVNQGQLKNIATAAVAELDANLPNGAGDTLWNLAAQLSATSQKTNDYAAVNLGQLKTVAKPFYDRLAVFSYQGSPLQPGQKYPWDTVNGIAKTPNDYAMANIGQVKNLFSFSFTLPDAWQMQHFGTLDVDPYADPDGDGLTNMQEYLGGTDPLDFFNGNLPASLAFVGGAGQSGSSGTILPVPLSVRVGDAPGLANAPVCFTVTSGSALLLATADAPLESATNTLLMRSAQYAYDSGSACSVAQAYVLLPDLNASNSRISATVQSGSLTLSGTTYAFTFDTTLVPPPNLVVTQISESSMRLDWTVGDSLHPTGVQVSFDSGANWTTIGVIAAGGTTATVTDILPSDLVSFQLFAVAVGTSTTSNTISVRQATPQDPPDPNPPGPPTTPMPPVQPVRLVPGTASLDNPANTSIYPTDSTALNALLIKNGNFSTPTLSKSWDIFEGGTGWTTVNADVNPFVELDAVSPLNDDAHPTFCDLISHTNATITIAGHGIKQTVNVSRGSYILIFDYFGRSGGCNNIMVTGNLAGGNPAVSLPSQSLANINATINTWKRAIIPVSITGGPSTGSDYQLTLTFDVANPSGTKGAFIGNVLLLPFELTSDLNNDGKIDGNDTTLKTASYKSGASADDIEKGTEYLFVNDNVSNGLWDNEDPNKPASAKEEDDLATFKVTCGATWGAVWFDHPKITELAFYKSKECKPSDQITFPLVLSATSTLESLLKDGKIYVAAEGDFSGQVEGDLVMKFGKEDQSETWASDKVKLTIVRQFGDTKFFQAARNYILENNTELFVHEWKYPFTNPTTTIRLCVMREEATTLNPYETYYSGGTVKGIDGVMAADSGMTVVINGNQCAFSNGMTTAEAWLRYQSGAPVMTDKCQGRLVIGGILSPASNDWYDKNTNAPGTSMKGSHLAGPDPIPGTSTPGGKYIAQDGNGKFSVGAGQMPTNVSNGMGGLSSSYNLGERSGYPNSMVGYAPMKKDGKGVVFVASGINFTQGNGRVVEFYQDAIKSMVPNLSGATPSNGMAIINLFLLDSGKTSPALAHHNPDGYWFTILRGSKQDGNAYYTNTFLRFKSQKPRTSP